MRLMIWQERIRRHWSQAQVATAIGIGRTAYTHIENGKRKPSYDVLVKLEDLFGLSHRTLFAEAPDEKPRDT